MNPAAETAGPAKKRRAPTFSPQALLARAAIAAVALLALHALGFREDVAILSKTFPASRTEVVAGCAYVVCYFAAVLAAPVLTIGAVVFAALLYLFPGRRA